MNREETINMLQKAAEKLAREHGFTDIEIGEEREKGLWVGDSFAFGDYRFTIISDKYALCDEIIGECHFKSNGQSSEASNDYETSDIKKFVDYWYEQELYVEKNLTEEDYEL